jgi:hypothetical protein
MNDSIPVGIGGLGLVATGAVFFAATPEVLFEALFDAPFAAPLALFGALFVAPPAFFAPFFDPPSPAPPWLSLMLSPPC